MPDICFFTNEQIHRLQPSFAPFAPTLVVEVLSSSTAERDNVWKFAAYEEHGVQEYWILDPETLSHHFYSRDGEFLTEFGQGQDVIAARTIPGFWVKRAWLNPDSLPEVGASFREIAGV